MTEQELLRLSSVRITGLFGIYDHTIQLNTNDRLTIVYGQNGVGKTVILRMINALLGNNLEYFTAIPFSRIELDFEDHQRLVLSARGLGSSREYQLSLYRKSAKLHESIIDPIRQQGDELIVAEQAALDHLGLTFTAPRTEQEAPATEWINEFFGRTRSYLIGADRLYHYDESSNKRDLIFGASQPSRVHYVKKCQEDFKNRMEATMIKYGVESQKLDSSLPRRLVSSAQQPLPGAEMKTRMADLDRRTSDLRRLGILEEGPPLPFSEIPEMDSSQAKAMSLCLDDAARKIGFLDDFANRAQAFLTNVNQKYRHKRLLLDRQSGIVAEGEQGGSIPLDALSSGEQQQLILQYDLLFRVQANTIVLIDEPELSLHLTWQQRFVPDLLKIIKLSNFDAMIATHSPFIAEARHDLTLALVEGN